MNETRLVLSVDQLEGICKLCREVDDRCYVLLETGLWDDMFPSDETQLKVLLSANNLEFKRDVLLDLVAVKAGTGERSETFSAQALVTRLKKKAAGKAE